MSVEFKAEQCVLKSELSCANTRFCERVYGRNLAEALKKEFETAGNGELINGRIGEGNAVLELAKAGKYRRLSLSCNGP